MSRVPQWYEDRGSPAYWTIRATAWRFFWKSWPALAVIGLAVFAAVIITAYHWLRR